MPTPAERIVQILLEVLRHPELVAALDAATKKRPAPAAVEPMVTPKDVVQQLGCSLSAAYSHMRRAVERAPGTRGMLRVRAIVWANYLERLERFGNAANDPPREVRMPRPRVARAARLETVMRGGRMVYADAPLIPVGQKPRPKKPKP